MTALPIIDSTAVAAAPPMAQLRPLERRVLRLMAEGVGEEDIARRFRRSPRWARQVALLATLPGRRCPDRVARRTVLRPLERRVLRWRMAGAPLSEIAERLRRSPEFVGRIETMARYKVEVRIP